jgi:hypothetical protein
MASKMIVIPMLAENKKSAATNAITIPGTQARAFAGIHRAATVWYISWKATSPSA